MIDVGRDLEILEKQKIEITRRLKDYSQISTKESLFTRSFQGPASGKNQDILMGYGILGTESAFNPHKGIPASWSFDAYVKFVGRLEYVNTVYKDGNPYLFNFNFYGEQKGLSIIFGSDRFSDLDWSEYDHTLTLTNVKNSWFGILAGGDLLYPLIDSRIGYFLGPESLNLGGNIRNENQPILLTDLKPAIKFQKLMKAVFTKYGLTLTGDIVDDDDGPWGNAFVLLNRFSGSGRSPDTYNENYCKWDQARSESVATSNTEQPIQFYNEVEDDSDLFNGLIYVSEQNGPHQVTGQFLAAMSGPEIFGRYAIVIYKNDVEVILFSQDLDGDVSNAFLFLSQYTLNLVVGDVVRFAYRRITYNVVGIGRPTEILNGFMEIKPPLNSVNQTVSLNSQMTDDKIIEWIAAFIESYNWVLKPDEFDDTKFELISAVDDRQNGTIRNWSDYLDLKNVVVEKPEVYKEVSFKYKESDSAIHEAYRVAAGKGFGDLTVRPDVDFGKGKFEVENPCTLIPPSMFKIVNGQGIPTGENADLTIHKSLDLSGGPVNESNLLFYYNGIFVTTYPYYMQSGVDAGGVISALQVLYPRISAFRGFGDTPLESLPFSIESTQEGEIPLETAYARYWEDDMLLQYDPASRVLKNIRLVLPPQEFYNYKMNDELFIQNEYWKIIEIKHDKDGKQATAILQSSRRLKAKNGKSISGGGKIVFDSEPSGLEKSAVGAFKKGADYYGSFLVAQITPDLSRYTEIITQTNQTIVNEINNISGRFRSYNEQS